MKPIFLRLAILLAAAFVFISDLAQAAGEKAEMLVVVADTRRVSWGPSVYFTDLYNTDPFMFGLVCTIITAIMGGGLGLLTDTIMKRTGLDLTSRKLVEH
jgi:hypothetical protein